jgi:phage terminase large subunit-like protein
MRGEYSDDSLFAYIARVDKDDDPMKDESCWIKALPALGITYPIENVRKLVVTAREQISTALTTKRLYFGIPVGSAGFWTSEEIWEKAKGEVDEVKMKGRRLHLSLDLSQKNDLTAVSGCWEGQKFAVKTWYWTREFEVDERTTADHIPYRELAATGKITITKGRVIDYSFVAKQIIDLCGSQDVVQMAVDAAHLEKLLEEFTKQGFAHWVYEGPDEPEGVGLKIVKHRQGMQVAFKSLGKKQKPSDEKSQTSAIDYLCMPTSITQLEDKMLNEQIEIDGNKLTDICASNTVVRMDAMSNRMFDKNVSRGRIDGMVTIAMAVGSAASAMEAAKGVYSGRAALVL